MPVEFLFENPLLKTWMLLHQTYNSVSKSEDMVFANTGLTTQQHAVLMAIKYLKNPATPTEIANWVDRNQNSITLIVDRMEKAGLVERVRDVGDRRSHRVQMTEKGKKTLDHATIAGWELIQQILSGLSESEMSTLTTLLQKVRQKAFEYAAPAETMEEVQIDEQKNMAEFLARVTERKTKTGINDL